MITAESVEKACSEVGEYSDDKMVDEFDRFFRAQPSICEFVVELTHDSGEKIQELSLFLSYMVFKATEIEQNGAVSAITHEEVESAYHDTESWMTQVGQAESADLQPAIAASLQRDTEPSLLQYVISELNEPMEEGADLDDEQKGEVFFILKTVIASLSPKRRIIEID